MPLPSNSRMKTDGLKHGAVRSQAAEVGFVDGQPPGDRRLHPTWTGPSEASHVSPAMRSCLYECRVMHHRFAPRTHGFVYRIFLFALDLDELEARPLRFGLFSTERTNLYSFRSRDFLPVDDTAGTDAASLRARVGAFCARQGVDITGGRVVLVTLPRVAGYLFNPVSFYFCLDRGGRPVAAIAEVTNTFREVKPYFLGPEALQTDGASFRLRVPKHFYVSPFSDVDVAFDFTLRLPGDRLDIQIDDYAGGARTLTSSLTGPRRELTPARLAWFTVKYPLITLRIIALIHWHALRLWWKRVPWFAKAARRSDQHGLYRPHHSLSLSDVS